MKFMYLPATVSFFLSTQTDCSHKQPEKVESDDINTLTNVDMENMTYGSPMRLQLNSTSVLFATKTHMSI